MSDHFDDQIRDALHAEAEGVTADGKLLERVRSRTRQAPRRARSSWLLVAAAVAVLGGIAATLVAQRDGDQTVSLVDDPDAAIAIPVEDLLPSAQELCADGPATVLVVVMGPDATEEDIAVMAARLKAADVADSPPIEDIGYVDQGDLLARMDGDGGPGDIDGTQLPSWFEVRMPAGTDDIDLRGEISDLPGVTNTMSTSCDNGAPAPPGRSSAAWVGVDGVLSALDPTSGEVVELAEMGDPRDDVTGGNPIFDVSLSSDGGWAYFGTCCPEDSRQGEVWRVRTEGSSPPERIATGYDPAVDPTGRFLAIADPVEGHLFVTTVDGDPVQHLDRPLGFRDPQWSPDGGRIVFSADEQSESKVYVVDVDPETGFGTPRELPGISHLPVWTAADRVAGIDLTAVCGDCAEPEPGDLVEVTLDGSEVSRRSAQQPVIDLATSAMGALAVVYADGSAIIYGELPAGMDDVPEGLMAIDW